jgi:hypothetical protein
MCKFTVISVNSSVFSSGCNTGHVFWTLFQCLLYSCSLLAFVPKTLPYNISCDLLMIYASMLWILISFCVQQPWRGFRCAPRCFLSISSLLNFHLVWFRLRFKPGIYFNYESLSRSLIWTPRYLPRWSETSTYKASDFTHHWIHPAGKEIQSFLLWI